MTRIALIGDYDPAVIAHQAIPAALELAAREARERLTWTWIHTASIEPDVAAQLAGYAGIWCVPASPYTNPAGAIAAIRHARLRGRPFLGTCGGFQHAMLEYAEASWGLADAAHAETDLVEVTDVVRLLPGTRLREIYGTDEAAEGYHCSYGLSARYASYLDQDPLRVAARDAAGEIRAVELDGHPFYFCTLYQPERSALAGRPHPLIAAFAAAVIRGRG